VRYGGSTSCLAIASTPAAGGEPGRPVLLLDAGTGLRRVAPLLGGHAFRGTILVTHFHWDHIEGIPFFGSGDREDATVSMMFPPQEDGTDSESVLGRMMSPPLFPIWPKDLRGRWSFDELPRAAFGSEGARIEGFTVVARDVPHKGGRTVGFRVSDGHSTLVYVPDHCPTAVGPGPSGLGEIHPAVLDLATGADLLVHDAFLVAEEVAELGMLGHAAAEYAVELGQRAGVAHVALFHHHPDRCDDDIDDIVARTADAAVPVRAAAEGTFIDL